MQLQCEQLKDMILKSMVVKMQIGIPNRLAVSIPQPGGSKLWVFFVRMGSVKHFHVKN